MKASRLLHLRAIVFATLVCAALLIFSGCSSPSGATTATPTATSPGSIKIGVLLPLTGVDAKLGEILRNSMELAADIEQGQINGHPLKLIFEDEGDQDETIALEKAKKLIQSDKADLIMGPLHDDSSLSVAAYTSALPIINVKWSPIGYSQVAIRDKNTFWTSQLNQSSSYPLGLFASENGIRTVTTLCTGDAISSDFMQGFIDGFRFSSGKVARQQAVPPGETDFSLYLSNLKNSDAFVIAISGDASVTALLKQYNEIASSKKMPLYVASIDGLSASVVHEIGSSLEGTYVVEKYLPDLNNAQNRRFLAAYRQKYQGDPDNQASDAYNGMQVLFEALKVTRGGTFPDILGPILRATETDLPTGHFQFSQTRTGIQPLRVVELAVSGGSPKLVMVKEYPPTEYYWQPYP
jgi:branched-chain amino acid transport system substrate-binding protein